MKKGLLLAVVVAMFLPSCSSQPKLAPAAYEELKKLEASTEVGITYADYFKRLGDVKYIVTNYLESEEASKNKTLANDVRATLLEYELAGKAWSFIFTPERGIVFMSDVGMSLQKHLDDVHDWPELILKQPYPFSPEILDPKKLLPLIWAKASGHLARVKVSLKDI